HGLYDVEVINPGGETAIVPYRYLIETALDAGIRVGLGGPRDLFPSDAGTYGFSIQSQSNVDTPYIYFEYGVPALPDLGQATRLLLQPGMHVGPPDGALKDVPWADLATEVNTTGEQLAPGYVLDLADRGYVGQTFTLQTYPELAELRQNDPAAFEAWL